MVYRIIGMRHRKCTQRERARKLRRERTKLLMNSLARLASARARARRKRKEREGRSTALLCNCCSSYKRKWASRGGQTTYHSASCLLMFSSFGLLRVVLDEFRSTRKSPLPCPPSWQNKPPRVPPSREGIFPHFVPGVNGTTRNTCVSRPVIVRESSCETLL